MLIESIQRLLDPSSTAGPKDGGGWKASPLPGVETIAGSVFSEPLEGWSFTGWYNGSDALISSNETISIGSAPVIRAEFEKSPGYLFGDADGNGTVDSTDALLILRYALGMISLDGSALALCDVDGNGTVDSDDALLTLRLALGMTAL